MATREERYHHLHSADICYNGFYNLATLCIEKSNRTYILQTSNSDHFRLFHFLKLLVYTQPDDTATTVSEFLRT
jgi:hypothetical protein